MRARLRQVDMCLIGIVVVMVVAIVVECDTVKFFKWIDNLTHWCRETRVQWYTLGPCGSDVYALTLLDIAEVGRLHALALMRDNGWFHVSK